MTDELKEVKALDKVNESSKNALAQKLANNMKQQKGDAKNEVEKAQELNKLKNMDKVNPESRSALASKLMLNMKKAKYAANKELEKQRELKKTKQIDAVNEDSKALLAAKLQKKLNMSKVLKKAAVNEGKELNELKKMNVVNDGTKDKLGGLLAKKLNSDKKSAALEVEGKKELNEIKNMDKVNEESQNKLGGLLANKLKKDKEAGDAELAKHQDMNKKALEKRANEEKKELAEVKELDAVNPESKKNLAALLGKKLEGDKLSAEQDLAEKKELNEVKNMNLVTKDTKNALTNKLEFNAVYAQLFELLDQDQDGNIDVNEFTDNCDAELNTTFFSTLDKNENKKLSRPELREMFVLADESLDTERVLSLITELKEHQFNVSFSYLWSLLDVNGDGKVDIKEFVGNDNEEFNTAFFKELDSNHDGVLTKKELIEMFILADGSLDKDRVDELAEEFKHNEFAREFDGLWRVLDKNKDKKVDVKEFTDNANSELNTEFLKLLDTNKDGVLSQKELIEMFILADGSMDTARAKSLAEELSKNKTK